MLPLFVNVFSEGPSLGLAVGVQSEHQAGCQRWDFIESAEGIEPLKAATVDPGLPNGYGSGDMLPACEVTLSRLFMITIKRNADCQT